MAADKQILLVTQKNATEDQPTEEDIYHIGTIGHCFAIAEIAGWHS